MDETKECVHDPESWYEHANGSIVCRCGLGIRLNRIRERMAKMEEVLRYLCGGPSHHLSAEARRRISAALSPMDVSTPLFRQIAFGRALRNILGQSVTCNDPLVVLAVEAITDAMCAHPDEWERAR